MQIGWPAQTLIGLGEAAHDELDEYDKAEAFYRESLSMMQESGMGSRWLIPPSLNLGYTVLYLGDDLSGSLIFQTGIETE